jgi:SAM-dependent methyltransferase
VTTYDAELRRHNEVLREACGVQSRDHVLDIGCGAGQTTREAARAAHSGSALGVDISAPAIERARELARAEDLGNITFECASAEVYRFPQERFDLAISRFGTMFFDDPAVAFANISRAVAHDRNEWEVTIRQSLGATVPSGLPDPFSLADPSTVTEILEGAEFADVTFTDVSEPVYYGPDVDAAMARVRGFACTGEVLKQLDPTTAERALGRLRAALVTHLSDGGVWFNSRAWVVTARRR